MLDRLIRAVERESGLPGVVSGRCVHTAMEQASCSACVDSCPRSAWQLDDESLGLDVEACDGCGLCAAACPESAIVHEHGPALRTVSGGSAALWACERTRLDLPGVVPCLHAVALRELLGLYRQGITELIVATGPCDDCQRSGNARLSTQVEQVNGMLRDRGLQPFKLRSVSPVLWAEFLAGSMHEPKGPTLDRRRFMGVGLATASEPMSSLSDAGEDEGDRLDGPATLIPRSGPGDRVPCVPSIDIDRCNGCDGCTRICPHGAIALETDELETRYLLDAERCTGCHLCIDICDRGAVRIAHWEQQEQFAVLLRTARCRACGNPFHVPENRLPQDSLCRICARVNHYGRLHQVLD
ncbi:MAG: 4Fe-4S binding protein [Gammaproteobacteria bacterium]